MDGAVSFDYVLNGVKASGLKSPVYLEWEGLRIRYEGTLSQIAEQIKTFLNCKDTLPKFVKLYDDSEGHCATMYL